MTMSLTFMATGTAVFPRDAGRLRVLRCAAVLAAAVLVAVAAPVSACDKSATPVASASGETRSAATFTGEFVNGAPVYRLPAITVVGRRQADVAKTQRNDGSPRAGRLRASAGAAAPAPGGSIASGSARRERDRAVHRMTPAKCARLIAIRARVRRARGAAQRRTRRRKRTDSRDSACGQPGPLSSGSCERSARSWRFSSSRCLSRRRRRTAGGRASTTCVSYDASGVWNPNV